MAHSNSSSSSELDFYQPAPSRVRSRSPLDFVMSDTQRRPSLRRRLAFRTSSPTVAMRFLASDPIIQVQLWLDEADFSIIPSPETSPISNSNEAARRKQIRDSLPMVIAPADFFCAICQDNTIDGVTTHACGRHYFHTRCLLQQYMGNDWRCGICRFIAEPPNFDFESAYHY